MVGAMVVAVLGVTPAMGAVEPTVALVLAGDPGRRPLAVAEGLLIAVASSTCGAQAATVLSSAAATSSRAIRCRFDK